MFSRGSRYRDVPVATEPDRDGRVRAAVQLRELPEVTGTHRHVVRAGDRLDQLATLYYGRPLDWWRICDANPEFASPLELLGLDSVVTTSFPLLDDEPEPRWEELIRTVTAVVGVERVRVSDDLQLRRRGDLVVEVPVRALLVTHNRSRVGAVELAELIRATVPVGAFFELSRLGQEIVVPPLARG